MSIVAESSEESAEEGADGEGRGREKASEHCASGPSPPSRPAARTCKERPVGWTQHGAPHPRATAAQSESAGCPAWSQEGYQNEVSMVVRIIVLTGAAVNRLCAIIKLATTGLRGCVVLGYRA